jgi:hypothetical protein
MAAYPYPEHAKLAEVTDRSQTIGEFLEWLGDMHQIRLAKYLKDDLVLLNIPVQDLLAMFFGIDLKKLEAEKRAMLEELRK